MEMLTTITFVSVIIWYIIDRIKPLWENLTFGKYLTTAAAGALSAVLTFFYGLDLCMPWAWLRLRAPSDLS